MPVFIPMLMTALVGIVSTVIGRVLLGLGLTIVYYRGLTVALDWAEQLFFTNMATLPGQVLSFAGVLQIGTCIKILFTTWGIRASILGLNSDGFKRLVLK